MSRPVWVGFFVLASGRGKQKHRAFLRCENAGGCKLFRFRRRRNDGCLSRQEKFADFGKAECRRITPAPTKTMSRPVWVGFFVLVGATRGCKLCPQGRRSLRQAKSRDRLLELPCLEVDGDGDAVRNSRRRPRRRACTHHIRDEKLWGAPKFSFLEHKK